MNRGAASTRISATPPICTSGPVKVGCPKDATGVLRLDTGVFVPTEYCTQFKDANSWFNSKASVLILPGEALGLIRPSNYRVDVRARVTQQTYNWNQDQWNGQVSTFNTFERALRNKACATLIDYLLRPEYMTKLMYQPGYAFSPDSEDETGYSEIQV